ncbi:MAG: hypothetical protein H6Q05_1355 [Acidobacteria bacterium]|nr:hypothetical protein [Acidobacteriota bacterium]
MSGKYRAWMERIHATWAEWTECRTGRPALFFLVTILAVVSLKAAFLYFDAVPRFLIGDSAVYIKSAFLIDRPADRSWAYGLVIIRPVLWLFGSLQSLVYFQAAVSALTAVALAAVLGCVFHVRPWVAGLMAVLYAMEPIGLQYERFVMTENPATFVLVLYFAAALLCLRNARPSCMVVVSLLSAGLVALRVSFLPTVVVLCLVLPMLVPIKRQDAPFSRNPAARLLLLALSAGSLALCHYGYLRVSEKVTGSRKYNIADGFFLLAAWSPLVQKDDFGNDVRAAAVLEDTTVYPRSRRNRAGQLFGEDGLIAGLLKVYPAEITANRTAHNAALHIAWRTPLGIAGLAAQSYADYWDDAYLDDRIAVEIGKKEIDAELIDLFARRYGEDITGHHLLSTVTTRYLSGSKAWIRLLLLSPALVMLAFVLDRYHRRETFVLALFLAGITFSFVALATEPVPRYLHSVAWLTLVLYGILLNSVLKLASRVALKR